MLGLVMGWGIGDGGVVPSSEGWVTITIMLSEEDGGSDGMVESGWKVCL